MILAFGTYDAQRHPRIAILIEGLRAHGLTVTEVNRPLAYSTAARVRILAQPWRVPVFAARLVAAWLRLAAAAWRFRRDHGRPRVVVVGYLGHFDALLARALFPRSFLVLDHLVFAGDTARDRRFGGWRAALLDRLDRLATGAADLVVVDTEEHRAMLGPSRSGLVVPVGAEQRWFEAARPPGLARASESPPVACPTPSGPATTLSIVFFGLFTPLQGVDVIAEAIRLAQQNLAGASVTVRATLIGQGQDYAEARRILAHAESITWLDWVEPARLPALVASHDICLGVFSINPKGLRVIPNKVYEGLAAGCAVITSDTPPQRRHVGSYLEVVPPGDPIALAARIVDLAARDRLEAARSRSAQARETIDPRSVVAPLVHRLATLTEP